jgi:2-C-methyl-D-erythritol 4-phosphate cytidylyltransferase / 2-C-methyl-D-erythritol 2,4-cyclodiphosphate synthase
VSERKRPQPGSADPIQAVIVAAGASRRMGGLDKLEAELEGRSVLRWSVEAVAAAGVARIVIVAAPARVAAIAAADWLPDCVVAVVAGGERRQESVAAGIAALAEDEAADADKGGAGPTRGAAANVAATGRAASHADPIILVHDAARPLASPALIRAVAEAAAKYGAAIPVLPVSETLKRLDGDRVGATVDRTDVVAAQTPQGVRRSLLERAYRSSPSTGPETWTDEASLLEACRIAVHAISGEATNLKVTVPVDLERARAMLDAGLVPGRPVASGRPAAHGRPAASGLSGATTTGSDAPARSGHAEFAAPGRVGLGTDSHPFGPGEPLVLCGLTIPGAPRLAGHSDGDVALHAVADALLGAAGLGDLGRLFPSDSRTPVGVDSRILLGAVAKQVRSAGWRPVNLDMTIVASRPKLSGLLPQMAAEIAAILGLHASAVNVKASSGNLEGSDGAGRSISASAIVWLAAFLESDPEERA